MIAKDEYGVPFIEARHHDIDTACVRKDNKCIVYIHPTKDGEMFYFKINRKQSRELGEKLLEAANFLEGTDE